MENFNQINIGMKYKKLKPRVRLVKPTKTQIVFLIRNIK